MAEYTIDKIEYDGNVYKLQDNESGYITEYTETDPVFTASPAHGISAQDIINWNGKVNKSGDTMTGNLTLYVASGNSPAIIFQRGTLTDNYNDWKIYDKSGFLYFAQRGSGSSDFADMGYFNTSGQAYFHVPWSYIDGKPNLVNTITTEAGAHTEKTNATGNVSFNVPTKTSHLTNDSGYITSADLPEGPLIGDTDEISPAEVLAALQAGRDVYITYPHATYGNIVATSFNSSTGFGVIASNMIGLYSDEFSKTHYMLFELLGQLTGGWTCYTTFLASESDIPSVPTTALSSTTGITASTTATKTTLGTASSVIGVQSSTTTASKVTVGSHSTDYGVKTAGSGSYTQGAFTGGSFTQGADSFTPNTPTVIDITKFNGGSYSHTGFSGGSGSFTQGSFSGGSGSFSATVNNHVLSFSHTHTAATHGADSHTHNAATYGTDSFTPASLEDGFYTAGTAASFTQGEDEFTPATHGADSHTHTAPTLGSKIPTVSASNVTVPIKDTGATSIPNVSVASATVTITDPGHTHQLGN